MHRNPSKTLLAVVCFLAIASVAQASGVELQAVQFPEKRPIGLTFTATPIAPAAKVTADVIHKQGQARIEMTYYAMKPAILFGGDVTCFVAWAVTRDGHAENLGELLTRKQSGKLTFSTGQKDFAVMVTAESFYLVGAPSELVVFYNAPSSLSNAVSVPFLFDGFQDAPRHNMDAIGHIKWDSKVPLDLLQARKAFELAGRNDAAVHASQIYAEAESAIGTANEYASSAPKSRELLDSARRAVALSNEAINISMHRIEAIELERQLASRREEMAVMEQRAAEAEATAEKAERLAAEVRAESDRIRVDHERMVAETSALNDERASLESLMLRLRQEKSALESESAELHRENSTLETESRRLAQEKVALTQEAQRLQTEKDALNGRLQSALSHVAETDQSVRGFVVNLPDILFDVNEATLKPEAELVMAKLAGILLIMPGQDALVEGHTDSTGSAEYNFDLSQRRASAVMQFLQLQGIDPQRLKAVGHGMDRPVADNSTPDGRRNNRRVEIVISESGKTVASN